MNNVVTVTTDEMTDLITRVVKNTLSNYYVKEKCDSAELKRAIEDRVDGVYEGVPVRTVFDYYEMVYGDYTIESQNDYFAKNIIEAFKHDKMSRLHYSEDEYGFYLDIAVSVFAREIRKILFNLGVEDNIDIQLVAVPQKNEKSHRDMWQKPMIMLGNGLGLTTHWGSYYYYEKVCPHNESGRLPKGNFNRTLFYDENTPQIVPHIIILTDVVSQKNFTLIKETKKKLENIGCEVLCVVGLSRLSQT